MIYVSEIDGMFSGQYFGLVIVLTMQHATMIFVWHE